MMWMELREAIQTLSEACKVFTVCSGDAGCCQFFAYCVSYHENCKRLGKFLEALDFHVSSVSFLSIVT